MEHDDDNIKELKEKLIELINTESETSKLLLLYKILIRL